MNLLVAERIVCYCASVTVPASASYHLQNTKHGVPITAMGHGKPTAQNIKRSQKAKRDELEASKRFHASPSASPPPNHGMPDQIASSSMPLTWLPHHLSPSLVRSFPTPACPGRRLGDSLPSSTTPSSIPPSHATPRRVPPKPHRYPNPSQPLSHAPCPSRLRRRRPPSSPLPRSPSQTASASIPAPHFLHYRASADDRGSASYAPSSKTARPRLPRRTPSATGSTGTGAGSDTTMPPSKRTSEATVTVAPAVTAGR